MMSSEPPHATTPTPEPLSRRAGRPPRLTSDGVIAEAIRCADADGLGLLSMPKLAKRLGVGTMTLYGYVANKRNLIDRMAASLLADIRIVPGPTWRDQITHYFGQIRQVARDHPSFPALLSAVRVDLAPMANDLEDLLVTMQDHGIPLSESLRLFDAALAYTIGFVVWETPRVDETDGRDQWRRLLADSDGDTYPALRRAIADDALTTDEDDRFEWGLQQIVTVRAGRTATEP